MAGRRLRRARERRGCRPHPRKEGSRFGPPELRRGWYIAIVPATPSVTNSTAATLDEAKAKFREEPCL
jgi:hypothetical protein